MPENDMFNRDLTVSKNVDAQASYFKVSPVA